MINTWTSIVTLKIYGKNWPKTTCFCASCKIHGSRKVTGSNECFHIVSIRYSPEIWMFYDRNMNNNINKIHERALRIAFKDTSSKFEDLLMKAASVIIHQSNLQLLTTEIYKTKNELNPKFMCEIFVERNISHNLRGYLSTNSTHKCRWFEGN